MCALLGKALPALVRINLLVALVGELGIGDRDFALEALQPRLLCRIDGGRDLLVELIVDESVDAADEEAGDACDLVRIAALLGERFEPRNISLGDLGIDLLGKQQGHVYVDTLAD